MEKLNWFMRHSIWFPLSILVLYIGIQFLNPTHKERINALLQQRCKLLEITVKAAYPVSIGMYASTIDFSMLRGEEFVLFAALAIWLFAFHLDQTTEKPS